MDPMFIRRNSCLLACLVVLSGLALTGCPLIPAARMTMLLNGGLAADVAAKDGEDEVPRDSIAAVYVVVEEVRLKQADGSYVTVFTGPFEVDILSLQGIGAVMASVDIPPGSYDGGVMVVSSASVEFTDNPGVLEPLVLPGTGQFHFEDEFTVTAQGYGVLKLHLDDIEVYILDDQSLQFSSTFEFEAEVEEADRDDDDDEDDVPVLIGYADAEGVIEKLEIEECEMELKLHEHGEMDVDICSASVLLPPLAEGEPPVSGALSDLVEDACVLISGDLYMVDDEIMVIADTIEVTAYGCDGDDDDHDDEDDYDDDDDDDDDDGEDEDDDEDEDDK